MIEDYENGITRIDKFAKKEAIMTASAMKGDNWNRPSWPTNSSNPTINSEKPTPTIDEIYDAIQEYGPIYAYYTDGINAHVVVVTGVDVFNNTIYTNNPHGYRGEQTYNEFLDGYAGMSSNSDMRFGFLIYPDM